MKVIGYIEISIGLGLGLGPAIGSTVYRYMQYEHTMYFFGGINVIALVVCLGAIPNKLNHSVSRQHYNEVQSYKDELMSHLNVISLTG